ncbi:hypothetical protein WDM22_38535 [Bradyrhizobium septentrionale]|uniref:hypothetical protein n=1 Tax=Bradyrhizobium septentrionale TaxID=1404411 RepID=UPI0030D02FB8
MPLVIIDGPTIAAGESLSDGVDCSAGEIVRITVPQEYTAANLTLQVSSDGNFYNDLFTSRGEEVTIAAKPSTGIIVAEPWVRSIAFIKFRSGTRDYPVDQNVDCNFAIAIETADAPAAASASRQRDTER